ncbi:TonB family protein [Roseomonas sp. JC162]|uniref:TonB family protein n=1 Tax=Neoroseomonas marina TaxID=1232220 RepID=A0A848EIT5_9PROT|nr:TonB family protein [Neoroseomonas marina]NMJ43872.1 TonB family protein [Neoroseomonas marina]
MRRRPGPGMRIPAAVSAALHGLFILAVLLEFDPRSRRAQQELPPPSFAMVFQGGSDQAPRGAEAPEEGPVVTAEAPPPAPPPPPPAPPRLAEAPPVPPPPAPPPPPTPTPPAPPPPPAPRTETPPPPQPPPPSTAPPAPTIPEPARPVEAGPPPPPPAPPVPTPAPPDRPPQRQLAEVPLPPPPPPPPPPTPAQPHQQPLDLTDRPPIRLGENDPSRARAPQRGLDLRPGATIPGPGDVENLRVRGAQAGPDWRNAFRAWLDRNLRYPREAADLGEEGPVTVRITTGADGRVRGVELRSASRSIYLNYYSQAVFRGANLPPFPPGTAEEQVTIDLTINYYIVRR